MSQIIQDPQKLRDFCDYLGNHTQFFKDSVSRLRNYMSNLGKSWEDDEFGKFSGEVAMLQLSLETYSDETNKVIASLNQHIEKLEKVQNTRLF